MREFFTRINRPKILASFWSKLATFKHFSIGVRLFSYLFFKICQECIEMSTAYVGPFHVWWLIGQTTTAILLAIEFSVGNTSPRWSDENRWSGRGVVAELVRRPEIEPVPPLWPAHICIFQLLFIWLVKLTFNLAFSQSFCRQAKNNETVTWKETSGERNNVFFSFRVE